jgi:hypothetical protein
MEVKLKMKHLISILKRLNCKSAQDLFKYLSDCIEYDEEGKIINSNDVKYYEFVIACLVAEKVITDDEAGELIESAESLVKIGVEYQNQIVALQTLTKSEESPNETTTT